MKTGECRRRRRRNGRKEKRHLSPATVIEWHRKKAGRKNKKKRTKKGDTTTTQKEERGGLQNIKSRSSETDLISNVFLTRTEDKDFDGIRVPKTNFRERRVATGRKESSPRKLYANACSRTGKEEKRA